MLDTVVPARPLSRFALPALVLVAGAAGLASGAIVFAAPPPDVPPAVSIRFSPERAYALQLDGQRGWQSIVVQNAALVVTGAAAVTLDEAFLETLAAPDVVVETRRFDADTLRAAAARGQALQQAGMIDAFAFHFHPEKLLAGGARAGSSATLSPGEALLLGQQVVAFQGARTGVRLRVRGHLVSGATIETSQVLPIVERPAAASEFDFPLTGRWYVGAGASFHSHHRWVAPEEFALDLAVVGEEGLTFRGDGRRRQDYLAYGRPVLAAAEGTVVGARFDLAETDDWLRRPEESDEAYAGRIGASQMALFASGGPVTAAGNHLVIDHGNGLYSVYAHLQPPTGPPIVAGTRVRRGQVLGAVGFSGAATEPHLHFHVVDGADPLASSGVPTRFRNVRLPFDEVPRDLQSGDLVETIAGD